MTQVLDIKDIRKGMKVKLVCNPHKYKIGNSNPMVGSKWECEGTVVQNNIGETEVQWKNGCFNVYKSGCLGLANQNIESIWLDDWYVRNRT